MLYDIGDTPHPGFLGVSVEANPRYFKGQMDEIRFWNEARTDEEIIRDFNRPGDSKSKGLVAYYDFNRNNDEIEVEKKMDANFYLTPLLREAVKLLENSSRTIE